MKVAKMSNVFKLPKILNSIEEQLVLGSVNLRFPSWWLMKLTWPWLE